VAYISEAPDLDPGKVDKMVSDAAAFSLQTSVTGVLLLNGKRFLQYIEGSEDGFV
jgi:hypothetical protein